MEDNSAETEVQEKTDDAITMDAFEKERQILLDGVAQSLSKVVQQMTKANENLNGLQCVCDEVEKVAGLWKNAYRQQSSSSSS